MPFTALVRQHYRLLARWYFGAKARLPLHSKHAPLPETYRWLPDLIHKLFFS
jgi:hypothetical protein